MSYKTELRLLIRDLPAQAQKNILEADKRTTATMRDALEKAESVRGARKNWVFATNCISDSPELTLLMEGYKAGITSLFNILAEAFWNHEESRDTFIGRLGTGESNIARVLMHRPEAKPPKPWEGLALLHNVIEASTDAWVVNAAQEWESKAEVNVRQMRLRRFCKDRGWRQMDVATEAEVPESELSRWAMQKPGDKRFIPDQSKTARKIEAVLRRKEPI